MVLTQTEKDFIRDNLQADVVDLALRLSGKSEWNVRLVLQQIAGYQALRDKVPSWYRQKDLLLPPSISLEQCSSEATAEYKRRVVDALPGIARMADLTGGMGVDCAFLAQGMKEVLYVERQETLCAMAENNFKVLGLPQIRVCLGDGVNVLGLESSLHGESLGVKPFDLIYVDPARRDRKGGKVVALADGEPDITRIKAFLLEQAMYVLVKLSPMHDVLAAWKALPETKEVHVVSVTGECKELLFLLQAPNQDTEAFGSEPSIHAVNLHPGKKDSILVFNRTLESRAQCRFTETLKRFLYEPNASLLKAGAFSLVSERYDLWKLHPNSHLYTSDCFVADFPGRIFEVESNFSLHSDDVKKFLPGIEKANIAVRNFPATVAEVRKKTGLREGGEVYLFATTLHGGKKVLVRCRKPQIRMLQAE